MHMLVVVEDAEGIETAVSLCKAHHVAREICRGQKCVLHAVSCTV
jgi:hypothetical protein